MSHGKQFTLFSHIGGPNGWKVASVLNILGLTYETTYLNNTEVKSPEYTTKYNPNGRVPAIIDHKNNDFILWESNAIVLYLIELYDKEHKISFESFGDKAILTQWLFFQASGQGPYFGQVFVFQGNFQARNPAAIERYQKETRRVLGVLESVLSKPESGGWIMGGRFSVADLSFVTWNNNLPVLLGEEFNFEKEFPATAAWHTKVVSMPPVKSCLEERLKLLAASQGH